MKGKRRTERRFTAVASMKHFIEKIAANGEKVVFMWNDAAGKPREITYEKFADMVKKEAAAFASLGYKNRRVAILGETSPAWVASYAAVIASGNTAIPMDRELDIKEIEDFLAFAEADAVIYSESFETKLKNARENHPTLSLFVPVCGSEAGVAAGGRRMIPFDDLIAAGEEYEKRTGYALASPEDMNRMAVMLFTSGTTGTSKCVMLSEKNVVASINAACECVEFFPEDTIVSTLPIHHTYELCCLLAGMNYGMNIGINDSLKRTLRNFKKYRPTGLVLVPLFITTMRKRIWDTARKEKKEKKLETALKLSKFMRKIGIDMRKILFGDITAAFGGRLTKIVSGGAPLNPELIYEFEQMGINIYEGYGITECSPLVSVTPYYAPKPGSVGTTVSNCKAKIDRERTNDLGYDEGEILVKGDNVMLGYYKNPKATAEAFTEDGYFRTGDEGYIDEDGYIYITGRKKYVIVLENGKNVFPEEIEEYLSRLESVGESVVLGRPGKNPGEVTLTALIYPSPEVFPEGTDAETIKKRLREDVDKMNQDLVGYKRIQEIEIREEEFEKTSSRKIKRHLIR